MFTFEFDSRNWTSILFVVVILLLIFNAINILYKSNIKKFSHDRIYIDYSNYGKESKKSHEHIKYSSTFYSQLTEAKQLINKGRAEAAFEAFIKESQERLAKAAPEQIMFRARRISEYEEIKKYAENPPPELNEAKVHIHNSRYDTAISILLNLIKSLPENDLINKAQAYDLLAECYFLLKDRQGYINNKVQYLQIMKKIKPIMAKAYPTININELGSWISPEEATKQLLRLKTTLANLPSEQAKMFETIVFRAELDAEVARAINQ